MSVTSNAWARLLLLAVCVLLGAVLLMLHAPSSETAAVDRPTSEPPEAGRLRGRPQPEEAPPELGDDTAPTALERTIEIRDLGTGGTVPGVEVKIRSQADRSSTTVISDRSGTVSVPAKDIDSLKIISEYWTPARVKTEKVLSSGVLWVHGPLQLRAVVEDEAGDPVPVEDVTFRVRALQYPRSTGGERSPPPWERVWLRNVRVDPYAMADADGRFQSTIPRLRALGIEALYKEQRSALLEIAPPAAQEPIIPVVDIRLRLQRTPSIRGSVRDETGRPIPDARVLVSVTRDIRAEDLDDTRVVPPGVAGGMTVRPDGSGTLSLDVCTLTDAQGRYALALPQEGQAVIEVLSEDHLAERIDLSSVEPGMSRDITLETADGCPPVRLLWGHQPIGAQQVLVCDVTDLDAQTSHAAQVGDDGMLPGQWLRYGRDYCIVATVQRGKEAEEAAGRVQRFFRWLGQDEVDLEALPGQLDAFKASHR